jgi:hypothetical protein
MFGLFKSRKTGVSDLLAGFQLYHQVVGQIAKSQSLEQLRRFEEAALIVRDTERAVLDRVRMHPTDTQSIVLLALFYLETGKKDAAAETIERILGSDRIALRSDERLILSAELQKIRRQRPVEQRHSQAPKGFTTIYCCQNCGRLHNFVSVPCPHCDWCPDTLDEVARSTVLSNAALSVPMLLLLSRAMAEGRSPDDIVRNLSQNAHEHLASAAGRRHAETVLGLLRENKHKHHRLLSKIRSCGTCGDRVLMSEAITCEVCDAPVEWPEAVRTLVCVDNLLWLFEQRSEPDPTDEFAELICVLVSIANDLLRKQVVPSDEIRRYALRLLQDVAIVWDLGMGGGIKTNNPQHLEIYLIKDSMRDETESMVAFWCSELEFFIERMTSGTRL